MILIVGVAAKVAPPQVPQARIVATELALISIPILIIAARVGTYARIHKPAATVPAACRGRLAPIAASAKDVNLWTLKDWCRIPVFKTGTFWCSCLPI